MDKSSHFQRGRIAVRLFQGQAFADVPHILFRQETLGAFTRMDIKLSCPWFSRRLLRSKTLLPLELGGDTLRQAYDEFVGSGKLGRSHHVFKRHGRIGERDVFVDPSIWPRIQAAGFPVERFLDGHLLQVSSGFADILNDFPDFSRRRAELKAFFPVDLFRIKEEPPASDQ